MARRDVFSWEKMDWSAFILLIYKLQARKGILMREGAEYFIPELILRISWLSV